MSNALILKDNEQTPADYGDTVLYLLDKLGNEALGPELAVNGEFTQWTAADVPDGYIKVGTHDVNNFVEENASGMRIVSDGTFVGVVDGDPLQEGAVYEVNLTCGAFTSGSVKVLIGTTQVLGVENSTVTEFIVAEGGTKIEIDRTIGVTDAIIESISVRELKGTHARQPSSALKPVYGRVPVGGRRNLLNPSEQFESGAWSKASAGSGSNPVVTPDYEDGVARVQFDKGGVGTTADISALQRTLSGVAPGTHAYTFCLRSTDGTSTYNMEIRDFNGDGVQQITVTGTYQEFTLVHDAAVSTPAIALRLSGGRNPSHPETADVLVKYAQFEPGSSATPYQRVTNDNDIFEAGSEHIEYLRFDHVDDTLIQTFPDGLTGDLIVCGTAGSWVDEGVSVAAGGDLTIGPKDLPNTAGVFPALGDIVGWVPIDRTLTGEERSRIIDYYKGRGAKGKLVPSGVELVTNGTFDSDLSGWGNGDEWFWDNGAAKITNASNATRYLTQNLPITLGKLYQVSYTVTSATGETEVRFGSSAPVGSFKASTGTGTFTTIMPWDGATEMLYLRATAAGDSATIDNISVQEMIPEEELA